MLATDVGDLCHPGDLFGALVKRRIYTKSALYQDDELFSLSLPILNDCDAPEIFATSKIVDSDTGKGFSEDKISSADASKNAHYGEATCMPESIDVSQPTAGKAADYFTLTSTESFAHSTAQLRMKQLADTDVAEASLLAMKGVQSSIFDLSHPPPYVTVKGYTALAMKAYLLEMRAYFVMRKLLDAACEGFRSSSSDGCALAMCTQLTTLLHLFDTSLAQLAADNASAPIDAAGSNESSDAIEERGWMEQEQSGAKSEPVGSLLVLWESSQLHRTVLSQLFAIVKPADLNVCRQDLRVYSHGNSISASPVHGKASKDIWKYLQPDSWAGLGGWSMLYTVVQGLQQARVTTNAISARPIFQHALFHNSSQFRYARPDGSADIVTDYAKMVITATVAQQLSVPLLVELKNKLYCLDADFTASDTVTDAELSDSLLVSIDAVWEQYTQRADASTGPEGCIQFLLAALAWSRGRVELLLLDHTVNGGDAAARSCRPHVQDSCGGAEDEGSAHEGPQRVVGKKPLIVPVRADAPGRVPKPLVNENNDAEFRRQDIVLAFRALQPNLRLPMNAADAADLQGVCESSQNLLVRLRDAARRSVGAWYKRYATMSDYYSEHAMNVNSMFADVDYHIRRPPPAAVAPPVPSRRKLVKKSREEASDANASKRVSDKPAKADVSAAGGDDDAVTLTSAVLGATRTVPKSLVAVAEQQIRAKYEGLMRSVDSRITATGWRKRQLQSLPVARVQLAELYAQDARELEVLRVAKETNAASYSKYLEDLRAGREAGSVAAPAAVEKVGATGAVLTARGRSPSPPRPRPQPANIPAAVQAPSRDTHAGMGDSSNRVAAVDALRREEATEGTAAGLVSAAGDSAKLSAVPEFPPVVTSDVDIPANKHEGSAVEYPACVPVVQHSAEATPQVELIPDASASVVSEAPHASPASSARSLADLAEAMLRPDKRYLDVEDSVYASLRSLSSVLVRLAQAAGLVEVPAEDVARLLEEAFRDSTVRSVSDVHARVLQAAARPTCSLHSLQTVFMRSLGQAVLTQCRAINVAAMHCLVSGAVDLLGHIKVVDNLLLVSPSSDFLTSLCTTMVDQHLQLLRVLHRQRVASAVAGLSHQFAVIRNSQMWNSTSLELGFQTTLTNTSAAQDWKKYSTEYASFRLNASLATTMGEIAADPGGPSTGLSSLWTKGLFSASGLQALELSYAAPWPVPAIISPAVLGKFACITRRFLEFGHIVALFRVVWGELRLFRVQKSKRPPAAGSLKYASKKVGSGGREGGGAKQAVENQKNLYTLHTGKDDAQKSASSRAERQEQYEVDRCVSDSMRLVQQVVQVLFDYLSERVYVHQARFKEHVALAVERGLDGIVSALNDYSSALAASALQLSVEEAEITRRVTGEGAAASPGLFLHDDPTLAMKLGLDALLESCRQVLRQAKAVNDLRASEKSSQEFARTAGTVPVVPDARSEVAGEETAVARAPLSGAELASLLQQLHAECAGIRAARAMVVEAAKRVSTYDMSQGDLQALVMRLEE